MSEQRLPNLFIVGSAKCGTTAYANFLNSHPEFYLPKVKEPSPFAEGYKYKMPINTYLQMYNCRQAFSTKYLIDASTPHLTSPQAAQKIFDLNPQAKIIVLLRNPVKRAFSLFHWMRANGYEWFNNFEYALSRESIRAESFMYDNPQYYWNYLYYESGLYFEQIKRYLNVFPHENIFVRPIDISSCPSNSIVDDLIKFLGANLSFLNLKRENQAQYVKSGQIQFVARHNFQDWKSSAHKPFPGLGRLAQGLQTINKISSTPKISDGVYNCLARKYLPSITRLENLLDLSLQEWKVL